MQKVAIYWEIYERTHSAIYLGYAGLVQFFPQVLLMLFAGHIVDLTEGVASVVRTASGATACH